MARAVLNRVRGFLMGVNRDFVLEVATAVDHYLHHFFIGEGSHSDNLIDNNRRRCIERLAKKNSRFIARFTTAHLKVSRDLLEHGR